VRYAVVSARGFEFEEEWPAAAAAQYVPSTLGWFDAGSFNFPE
jgi:hypothetical protein